MRRPQRLACLAKQLGDRLVRSEDEPVEPHGNLTGRTPQRIIPRSAAALLPGQGTHRRGFRFLGLFGLGLSEHGASVRQVVLAPTSGKQPCIAHHLEVLVRNVADQTPDESQHRQRLVRGLATLRIVLEGEADGAALAVVVSASVIA